MVTSVTTATMTGLGLLLGLVAMICLIVLLATKQLVSANAGPKQSFLAKSLNIGIAPLIIVFAMIVVMKLVVIIV